MKVFLLGATGNVGSRTVPALLAHKHQVVVYVRSESKLKEILPPSALVEITVITGDATDSAALVEALVTHNCDAFVNTAGLSSVFPWQSPRMQGIIDAISAAGVEASKRLSHPIRAWFMGGMGALDYPGREGTMIMTYFPFFTEHKMTFATLSAKPLENLQWSLLCPGQMVPDHPTVASVDEYRPNPLVSSADVPPGWQESYFQNVPFFGTLFGILGNALNYKIKLEDCAEFIASDLEKTNSEYVGHRVGIREQAKGKIE